MKKYFFLIVLSLSLLNFVSAQKNTEVNSNTFGEIRARHIGSATMSGRISAIDAVVENPEIVYIGSASGGLWKSKNAGVKFKAVFEDYTQSIGAIAIVQNNPDTVYVGTGESWVRNSVSVGDGVYKTTDGGSSWKHIGLKESEHIARIVIHPENPEIVYVAVCGHLWNANEERGVYRTKDGGESWEKVLYVDENTGASDITINPENPDILYAGMWDHRRKPYTFRSGGPGSGVYKSIDGGDNWTKLGEGLPETNLGRIAVAISPLKTEMVYALVEAEDKLGGLYRSDDDGESWEMVNKTIAMTERPFYFSQIYPDHVDTMKVYKPSFNLNVSDNGGKNFKLAYIGGGNVHVDHHAFWVSRNNNKMMYLGTDGGVYRSYDQGKTWTMIRNLPVSQFYRVSVDMQHPYNVYGGLQDNGSWFGPSNSPGGIKNSDWKNIGFGDGFYVFSDKEDSNILYWQSQGGNFVRYYKNSREYKEIKPYGNSEIGDLRWNWNSAIAISPTTNDMYVGSQYLFKSSDKGDSWTKISDDLTKNDKSRLNQSESGGITVDNSTAENNCTIYSIAESPLNNQIIWVGTDDGNLQVTKDGGKTWTNCILNVPGLPENTWVSNVEAGRFNEATVFVSFDNHREGDLNPYLYKSDDYGKTFTSLVDENIEGYCHEIIQDLVKPSLLFLGTEFGLFTSIDGGSHWSRFKTNIPKVAIHEMVIQPREHDLVMATHGRGILIIDDISPLRALNNDMLDDELSFLPSRPYVISNSSFRQSYSGDDEFNGENPQDAAYISYYLKKRHVFGDMYVEIYNSEGEKVATLPAGKRKGINRAVWTPREKSPKVPASNTLARGAFLGPTQPPGEYLVKIIKGDKAFKGKINIKFDDNLSHSDEDKALQLKSLQKAYNMLEDIAFLDAKILDLSTKLNKHKELGLTKSNLKKIDPVISELDDIHRKLVATKLGGITGEEQLREKISNIYGSIMSYAGKPTKSQIERLNILSLETEKKEGKTESIFETELKSINKILEKNGGEKIVLLSKEEFDKK